MVLFQYRFDQIYQYLELNELRKKHTNGLEKKGIYFLLLFLIFHSIFRKDMVKNLDNNVRDRICEKLNKKTIRATHFRHLAKLMNYNNQKIEVFEQKDNPTYSLLEEWQIEPTSTKEVLIALLSQMKRDDVIQILNKT